MYPEDRVLITALPRPADFARLQREGWYRIPQRHAPKGLYAEYFAFYFGSRFGHQKWAIHYYAPRLGHELTTRRELLPDEPDHPRADELYYKVQLGQLRPLTQPIVSLQWRRITFLHTTWDRFQDATEINDLTIDGGYYVNREFAALKETPSPVQRYRTNHSHGRHRTHPAHQQINEKSQRIDLELWGTQPPPDLILHARFLHRNGLITTPTTYAPLQHTSSYAV